MPRIPTYEQRTFAQGSLQVTPDLGPVGQGAQAMGAALMDVAAGVFDHNAADRRKAEADDLTSQHLQVTKAEAEWAQHFERRSREAPVGAAGFTPALLDDFDKFEADARKGAQTDRGRAYLGEQLAGLRSRLAVQATRFEADAGVRHRARQYDESLDQAQIAVRADPSRFEAAIGRQQMVLDAAGLDADVRETAWAATREKMAGAAVDALVERAPGEMLKALGSAPGKSGYASVELLSPEGRDRARSRAESEIRRREADARARAVEARDTLREQEADAMAARAAGIDAVLPPKTAYLAAYGADGEARHKQATQLFGVYDVVSSAVLLPQAEGIATVSQYQPTQQQGAAAQAQVQQAAIGLYQRQRKQFEDDPAGTLVRRDPDLAGLYQRGVQGDTTALRQYASRSRAMQQQAGIAQPKLLPANVADDIASSLTFDPDKPGRRAETLAQMAQQFGSLYPQAIREIAPKLEPQARLLALMRPEEAKRADQVFALEGKKSLELLSSKDRGKLADEVRVALQPLANTLQAAADGDARLAEHLEAAQLLAASYVNRGASPAEAAQRAATVLVNERYEYRGSWRMPKTVGDADRIETAAEVAARTVVPGDLAVVPMRSASEADAQAELAARVAKDGYWVTSSSDAGLTLMVPTNAGPLVVTRKDGTAIRYTWDQLASMPTTAPGRMTSPYTMSGRK